MSETAVGTIQLLNYSGKTWIRTNIKSKLMTLWDKQFPDVVLTGRRYNVPVEFYWSMFQALEDEWGEVTYQLEDTQHSFTIKATGESGKCEVFINWGTVPVLNSSLTDWILDNNTPATAYAPNSLINLNWHKHGHGHIAVQLFQSHVPNYYTNNISMADRFIIGQSWMSQFYPFFHDIPLNQLCLPGSKDAGCSELNYNSKYAVFKDTFIAQYDNILGQLQQGARFLDIRPCLHDGKWTTSRYYKTTELDVFGGDGVDLETVIKNVNTFTATNNELIIIHINDPTLITNNTSYTSFQQNHYNDLFAQLQRINHLYTTTTTTNLTNYPLSHFLDRNNKNTIMRDDANNNTMPNNLKPCVLIIIEQPNTFKLQTNSQIGFHLSTTSFPLYQKCTLSHHTEEVFVEQMNVISKCPLPIPNAQDNQYIVANWSLYQTTRDAQWSTIGWNSHSLLGLSWQVLRVMQNEFAAVCSLRDKFPNVVLTHGFDKLMTKYVLIVNLIQRFKRVFNWPERSLRPSTEIHSQTQQQPQQQPQQQSIPLQTPPPQEGEIKQQVQEQQQEVTQEPVVEKPVVVEEIQQQVEEVQQPVEEVQQPVEEPKQDEEQIEQQPEEEPQQQSDDLNEE